MNEWKMVRLGDVCEIQSGGTPSRSKTEYWKNGTIPWVKIGDFSGKYLNKTTEHITPKGLENSSAKLFSKGTILYSIFATLGEATILNIDATTNQAIAGIKIKDKSSIDIDYLFAYLNSLKEEVKRIGRGVAQNNINLSILKSFTVPLPPLETQKHIAAMLDKCTALVAKYKLMLEKYDTLIKSEFVEMFGENPVESGKWKVERLGNLCTITSGGTPDRKNEEYWKNGTIPWVKTTELQNNELSIVEEYITEKGLDESAAKIVPEETILLAMYGQGKTRGMTAFLKIQASTNQACACILPTKSKELSQRFIWYFLIMNYENIRNLAVGCNQLNLNSNLVKSIQIPIPPLDLQNQFAAFVQQIDKSKFAVQKSLEKAETLYKSLMQEYFG